MSKTLSTSSSTIQQWSDLNIESRFAPIKVDLKDYEYDVTEFDRDERFESIIRQFMIDKEHNPEREDIKRRMRANPGPKMNRLAFPTINGYTTYGNYTTAKFFIDFYNLCKAHGLFEPRLLVNHAAQQAWRSKILKNPDYQCNLNISKDYLNVWHKFLRKLISLAEIDKIKFYSHKNTSPGPPFSFVDGLFYSKDDILYGSSSDMSNMVQIALKKDYTAVKKTYFPFFEDIHFQQVRLSEIGLLNLNESVIKYYLSSVLPTAVIGYRFNNIDKVFNVDKDTKVTTDYLCLTKDRQFSIVGPKKIRVGKLNNKKFTEDVIDKGDFKYKFASQRTREVVNFNWPSQCSATVNSKMVTQFIEESVNGFASVAPHVVASYKRFVDYANGKGSDFLFINGDRSNAETFVTTNYDEFRQLILPELVKLYDFQDTVVILENNPYVVSGLPSGMGRTTELNWYMGTFEAIFTISQMIRVDIRSVLLKYTECVLSNADFFTINEFDIKLFMVTDDIPLIITGPVEKLDLSILNKGKERFMEWEYSSEKMSTFGMTFDKYQIKANDVSVVAKLCYNEHPGFFVKDCFSMDAKMTMLPDDLRSDINELFLKHFGTDLAFYKSAGQAFLGWLSELGIPINAAVDIYSPQGKILYGDLVSKDELLASARIDPSYFEPIFKYYKEITNVPS